METNQKPWNYLEKPCKPSKNHEKPWNHLKKPWKPTKNQIVSRKNTPLKPLISKFTNKSTKVSTPLWPLLSFGAEHAKHKSFSDYFVTLFWVYKTANPLSTTVASLLFCPHCCAWWWWHAGLTKRNKNSSLKQLIAQLPRRRRKKHLASFLLLPRKDLDLLYSF